MNDTLKTQKKRIVGKPFEKGNTFGKGRHKKENTYSDIVRELLNAQELSLTITTPKEKKQIKMTADNTLYHAIAIGQINRAMSGDTQAAREIIDRADGKVKEKLDLNTEQVIRVIDAKDVITET